MDKFRKVAQQALKNSQKQISESRRQIRNNDSYQKFNSNLESNQHYKNFNKLKRNFTPTQSTMKKITENLRQKMNETSEDIEHTYKQREKVVDAKKRKEKVSRAKKISEDIENMDGTKKLLDWKNKIEEGLRNHANVYRDNPNNPNARDQALYDRGHGNMGHHVDNKTNQKYDQRDPYGRRAYGNKDASGKKLFDAEKIKETFKTAFYDPKQVQGTKVNVNTAKRTLGINVNDPIPNEKELEEKYNQLMKYQVMLGNDSNVDRIQSCYRCLLEERRRQL